MQSKTQREMRRDALTSVSKALQFVLSFNRNSTKCTLKNLMCSAFPLADLRWPVEDQFFLFIVDLEALESS